MINSSTWNQRVNLRVNEISIWEIWFCSILTIYLDLVFWFDKILTYILIKKVLKKFGGIWETCIHTGAKSFQNKFQSPGCEQLNALMTYFLLHFSNKFKLFWFTGIKFLLFPFLTHSIDKAKMSQKNHYDANTSCLLYKLVKQLPHYKGKYH